MKLTRAFALAVFVLAAVACGKVPQAAVDAAEAAIDAAVAAEAPVYAAEAFAKAQGFVTSMKAEAVAQAAKSGLKRSYKNVALLAGQAVEAAKLADAAALRGREQAAADVARMMPEVEKLLTDADAKIRQAAAIRGISLDIDQLKAQLEAGTTSLEQAKRDQTARKLMDARNKLQAISDALAAAARVIDEATKARS
jgi:hypothetical protein